MTTEEYESLQNEVVKNMRKQMDSALLYSLKFSSIKHKVAERLIAEKGGFTLFELEEEIEKELKKY